MKRKKRVNKKNIFKKDFVMVFIILDYLEKNYENFSFPQIKYVKKFKSLIKKWNKKYKNPKFKFIDTGIYYSLFIYILKKSFNSIIPLIKELKDFSKIKINSKKRELKAFFNEKSNKKVLIIRQMKNKLR
ncbi:hypothetical protein JXB41_02930, partial [Candidatus Woesearchaeota archaeon]|nr:hypothetical protein [Candidatus Woesearchaeota archaeon]